MRSLRSLPSQKTGAIYSLVLLVAVMALVVGILSVSSAKFSTSPTNQFTPRWALGGGANASLNITITNDATSPAVIRRVDIQKPSAVSNIECGPGTSFTGSEAWTCSRTASTVRFDHTVGLAAGSAVNFSINITPPAGAGNYSFTIDTFEAGGANVNSTNINVSVDANPPSIKLMNISTSGKNISTDADFTSLVHIFLSNASNISVVVEVLDNGSGVGNVTLVYNYTLDINTAPLQVPTRDPLNIANVTVVNMTNQSTGSLDLFTYTFPTTLFLNGSKVVFSILANDTVGNLNISNKTSTVGWNFTIDAAAPRFEDVQIANYSALSNTSSGGLGINSTKTFGSTVEHILNSSVLLNVSAVVSDGGGSGVIKVEIMNRSGAFTVVESLLNGANGSNARTVWNYSLYNITDLARPNFAGDGKYNITFRVTDNVSNAVISNFTVEVDDAPPKGFVSTNLTLDGKLSESNITFLALTASVNTTFVLRLQTSNNINNVTGNASVFGNKGLIHNLTYESGTPSGTSYWNISIGNNITDGGSLTRFNLSEFCDLADADGSQCNFRFNFSDVLGRYNDTINLTVITDAVAPNVSIVAPVSILTNYSTSVAINVWANDTVGPLRNVSFRWRNDSKVGDNAGAGNISNWMSMSLNSGGNTQFSAQGYWTATLDISAVADGNYSIEVNATDSAGRQNATVFVAQVIFDSTRPFNVSIRTPASNSFHKDNTTFTGWTTTNITAVANETNSAVGGNNQSGIFNVSFRLENSSFNWPWVPATTSPVASALVRGVLFSPNDANLTHWSGQPTNATNGNFTIRLNVTDTAGNQNTSVTINVTIDTVVPSVSFIYPGNNQNQSGNFTINSTVTESNVASVSFRWVNGSGTTADHKGPFVTMTSGTATTFNGTFTNLTVTPALFDGNYTIELNVTDRAGWNTTTYIQLILDKNQPLIVATGSNRTTDLLDKSNHTGDFVVNLTINDTSSWNMQLGRINTTNINASTFRLENATFNGSWLGLPFATGDMTTTDSNRTNATFTFSSVANGLYDIRFMVNDTAGNQNNSVRISNVMLDNVAPGVTLSVTNLTPSPSGGAGITGTLNFNASVTDNLPVNISITNSTSVQNNKFGVFYRFEGASVTTPWLPMNTQSLQLQSLSQPHNVVFNGSNITTSLADGDYNLRINATDSAGNQNTTVFVGVTIQNSASSVRARNLTFLEGTWNGMANSSTGSYTFLVNTTANATCLYSLDNSKVDYDDMLPQTPSNTMTNNVSRQHRISFGSLSDIASSGHTLYYVCKDVSGNFTASNGAASQFPFGVDTRSRWNVTIPGKTDNNWPNYFQPAPSGSSANGWSSFTLSTLATDASTLGIASTQGGSNVTNVLQSLLQGTAAGNFTRVYAYNASTNSWQTFRIGETGNTLINFTGQTEFWINITATERLEIN